MMLLRTGNSVCFSRGPSSVLLVTLFLLLVFCETNNSASASQADREDLSHIPPESYVHTCEAFFRGYVEAAGNFTHCELSNAKPYRICTGCYEPYAIMKSLYDDLTADPKLHKCMIKYLKSDRVQIIPTMQKNADSLWETSDCKTCISHLHVDEKTKSVHFTVPENIHTFFILYYNISECLNRSSNLDILNAKEGNVSEYCTLCHKSYQTLNDHYNSMANSAKGDVCMDVVDMMNYTRVMWSVDLNCSHRSGDAASVVIITLAVAVSPLFFYLPLRYTSKEMIKQVLKQKRLEPNSEGFLTSASSSFAARDGSSRPSTSLPPMGS